MSVHAISKVALCVVVEGFLKNFGKFEAKTVLAKHDENYMPPEIKDIKSIKDNKI